LRDRRRTDTDALVPLPVAGFARMQTHYSLVTLAGRTLSAAATVYTRLVTELMSPDQAAPRALSQNGLLPTTPSLLQ
jgi:hypothetical protein